jgi:hypothetical protein
MAKKNDNMNMGTPPDLTTQGMPTRKNVSEDMGNVSGKQWTQDQYAGYKGAPAVKILPGGSPV